MDERNWDVYSGQFAIVWQYTVFIHRWTVTRKLKSMYYMRTFIFFFCRCFSHFVGTPTTLLSWFVSHSMLSDWHLCTQWRIHRNRTLYTLFCVQSIYHCLMVVFLTCWNIDGITSKCLSVQKMIHTKKAHANILKHEKKFTRMKRNNLSV